MNIIDIAIKATLCGGTTLTNKLAGTASVYHIRAPDNASYPYVVFNVQGGGPENITPSDICNYVYYVRGYTETSATNASEIHNEIRALLDKSTLTVSGYTNFWTRLETELEFAEEQSNNTPLYSSGGLYRVRIDQ